MTLQEAMKQRHTVRKYKDTPLPTDMVEKLNARVSQNNEDHGLNIRLVTNDGGAIPGILKMMMTKGVKNYFLLAPTVMNHQSSTIKGSGNRVSMTYPDIAFAGADMGISKYHFELGAGKENFVWE